MPGAAVKNFPKSGAIFSIYILLAGTCNLLFFGPSNKTSPKWENPAYVQMLLLYLQCKTEMHIILQRISIVWNSAFCSTIPGCGLPQIMCTPSMESKITTIQSYC